MGGSKAANGYEYLPSHGEVTTKLSWRVVVTVVYVLSGTFLSGWCMAALNAPANLIKEFLNETSVVSGHQEMSRDMQSSLYGLLSSIYTVGAGISSLCTQKMADFMGRRNLVALAAVATAVSGLLMGLAKPAESLVMLFVGRVITGFASGTQLALMPFYLSEVLPRRYVSRSLALSVTVNIMGGVFVAIIGFDELFATPSLWPVIVASQGVIGLLQLVLLVGVVPSPYFLLLKNKESEAVQVLQLLRGTEEVTDDLAELKKSMENRDKMEELTVIRLLRTRSLWKVLVITTASFVAMRLTGAVLVIFYTVPVLQAAGLSERVARYASTGSYGVGAVSSLLAMSFVHRQPRRRMLLAGLSGLLLGSSVLSLSLIYGEGISWLQIAGVLCLPLMCAAHACGTGLVPWLLITELFESPARGALSSLCVMIQWFSFFVVGYAFPPLQEAVGPYAVLPFVGFSAFFLVFFYVLLPEPHREQTETIKAG